VSWQEQEALADGHAGRAPSVPGLRLSALAAACVPAAAATFAWWVSSHQPGGDYYWAVAGPYRVPLVLEYVIGVAVIVGALVVLVIRPTPRKGGLGISIFTVAWLTAASIFAALAWRAITGPSDGANIGGAIAAGTAPIFIAALLVAAAMTERYSRGNRFRGFWLWLSAAIATAPLLFALVTALH